MPVILAVIARQKPGSAQSIGIFWRDLVGGDHLHDHAVIALILVQRLDYPIAPAPHESMTVANIIAFAPTIPVAISPDIHPVPGPTLSIARVGEQPIHRSFIR